MPKPSDRLSKIIERLIERRRPIIERIRQRIKEILGEEV